MTISKVILGTLVVGTLAAAALPAAARTNVDLYVNLGPPPPAYYEPVPAPRVGYAWVPGYWDWRGHRHQWIAGHWTRSRAGYVYHTPRYYARDGRWYVAQGGWRSDTDRDGIPNRYDRDRDNDGVANRYDRAPDNPYRN